MMNFNRTPGQRHSSPTAFTLVELLVVIAIIGLLVSILVPAISAVRGTAQAAAVRAQIEALSQGLDMYRGEQTLGGSYPFSSTDSDNRAQINDPLVEAENAIDVAGSHLLVHAMLGADLNGPPGFLDLDRDGKWWNDTHKGEGGTYELTPEAEPVKRRFESGFVDDKMKGSVRTLGGLLETGTMLNIDQMYANAADPTIGTMGQYLFVDKWDHPILYYRANRAARRVTGSTASGTTPPIYRQEDNAIITGSNASGFTRAGADFGMGITYDNMVHPMLLPTQEPALPAEILQDTGQNEIYTNNIFDNTFTRYILDPNSRGRNAPVRNDSYLLISAGADGFYGTEDDVTNWQRVSN
ncbi:MAG: type II secretion system protein [Planctomycetota bacterium]|jgi:prepilin-type N-terminal cleavage/methylation domain-containing protein